MKYNDRKRHAELRQFIANNWHKRAEMRELMKEIIAEARFLNKLPQWREILESKNWKLGKSATISNLNRGIKND